MTKIFDALRVVLSDYPTSFKNFYGSAEGLPQGVGLIYDDVVFPVLDNNSKIFATVSGPVLVLTHECDISQDNERVLNEDLLVCPIILFEHFVETFSDDDLRNILPQLGRNRIHRLMFLPPHLGILDKGGIISFNNICSTHISLLKEPSEALCTLSAAGLRTLDLKLTQHLFREKSVVLPHTYYYLPNWHTRH